jgi:hypothetical protein
MCHGGRTSIARGAGATTGGAGCAVGADCGSASLWGCCGLVPCRADAEGDYQGDDEDAQQKPFFGCRIGLSRLRSNARPLRGLTE